MSEIKIELKEQAKELYERLLGIVRCKDCKYWYGSTCKDGCDRGLCHTSVTMEDDYCSYGERKDETD